MLTFTNPGVLDPRAITTFGINVKENANPIGSFGTGLKYAIAVVLRLGGAIAIQTEDEDQTLSYDFVAIPEEVRGKTFHFVHMETRRLGVEGGTSQPLGFTTELGKHWAPWMAYRELRSNTMDEGGSVYVASATAVWFRAKPHTTISVNCTEIEAAHAEGAHYFLETVPLWASADLEIHPPRNDGAVFYRGICVAYIEQAQSVYTYNILREEQLTEDRTLDRWTCSWRITSAVAMLTNAELAEAILLAQPETYEASLSFAYVSAFSDEMRAVMWLQQRNAALNSSAALRARTLYKTAFAPLALPMTAAHRCKVALVQELLAACDIQVAWVDIRLGDMTPEAKDEVFLCDGILWVSQASLEAETWLLHILANRNLALPWRAFRREEQLLSVMRQAHPALAVFQD